MPDTSLAGHDRGSTTASGVRPGGPAEPGAEPIPRRWDTPGRGRVARMASGRSVACPGMRSVVVASFNVHGGVDGWGRPFDVLDACRRIDADVLMLQESWAPDGEEPMAQSLARLLGYRALELTSARGRIVAAPDDAPPRWGPRMWSPSLHGLRLDRRRDQAKANRGVPRPRLASAVRGTWSIAVLSRLPVLSSHTIDLGKLPTDPARRGAIVVDLDIGDADAPLRVVGTHLAHLSQGSPRHIASLRRTLTRADSGSMRVGGGHEHVGPAAAGPASRVVARRARSDLADMDVVAGSTARPHPRPGACSGRARRGAADPAVRTISPFGPRL